MISVSNILEVLTVRYNEGLKRACIFFISVFFNFIKIRPQRFLLLLLLMIQPLYGNRTTKICLEGLFLVCDDTAIFKSLYSDQWIAL